MSTSPSSFHQWITKRIARVLLAQIDDTGIGETFWAPLGVFMPGCDPVQPDLFVVRTDELAIVQTRIEGVPSLLVEILSPSNSSADTDVKRHAYARAGAPLWRFTIRKSTRARLCARGGADTARFRRRA